MVQEQPSKYNNGKSSKPTNSISNEKIEQALEQSLQNQRGIVSNWLPGYELKGGRYIIQEELSTGGFGVIYRAKDSRKNQVLVIKVLKSDLYNEQESDSFEENFVKEAINLAICKNLYIVPFKDLIKTSGKWCIVMEYIEGEDLNKWVRKNGPLSEADALRYIRQIGEALKVLHEHNLLHRDVNPKNIIRRANGLEAVLIDLGIARKFSHNQTEQHTPILTQDFAPIEQYREKYKRGAYTDVYALAATLYFLLTGNAPIASWRRLNGEPLKTPQQIKGKQYISEQVNDAILLGLQIFPQERPETIQEWLEKLPPDESKIEEATYQYNRTTNTNKEERDVSKRTQPPNDTQPNQPNPRKLLSLPAAFTSPASFMVALAIFSSLGTSFISAGLWLLLTICFIYVDFFITKRCTIKQQIGLVISTLSPPLVILLYIFALRHWKAQEVEPLGWAPETFYYGGSTTWAPIRRDVDPQIQKFFPNFKLKLVNPKSVNPGSETGIKQLLGLLDGEERLTFAQSSRPFTGDEYKKAHTQGFLLKQIPVAIDGIVVAVNPKLNISGLTISELKAIYQSKITNWNQVKGSNNLNLPIKPYSRKKEVGGTVKIFVEDVLENSDFGTTVEFKEDTTSALKLVQSDMGSIYYASAPEVVKQCNIKALPLGYRFNQLVSPYQKRFLSYKDCIQEGRNRVNIEVFRNKQYPLIRKLYVILKEDHPDQQAGEAYANLLLTAEGQQLLEKAGYASLYDTQAN
ncbi:serine/threonine-protein kinase [Brasilonema bromeliae]|uniref:Protein kinase domain-containing protein n=1 Tax=Brasilonema bromeliae SPC951 TaxID=385972 RepID=A0ABX1PCH5_9CYAN|nr:serine/threonine-protein kinase [Brasilonema bromeliae]NMG22183.1 hypothetical protein [Brasilonema bromeliae SPC951]